MHRSAVYLQVACLLDGRLYRQDDLLPLLQPWQRCKILRQRLACKICAHINVQRLQKARGVYTQKYAILQAFGQLP